MKQGILTLMFSTTGSIAAYQRAGSYPRFMARLQTYADHFEAVHVCTLDMRDYTAEWGLSNAFHHPMPHLPATSMLYHVLSPLIHRHALRHTTVIRTFNITGALPALLLKAFTGAPVFVSYGYSLPDFVRFQSGRLKYWLYRLVEEIALRAGDRIIVATPGQGRKLGARYGEHKIIWLPNFVDTDRFRPGEAPRSDYLLFVGRFTAQKDLATLLRALAQAVPQRPLKLVGRGEKEASLRTLAAELGLTVEFTGVLPNDRLPEVYASAWAFVLPSHFEGMPKALLEAMACGTPCLCSDVEGIRDLIIDGETGLLAPPTVDGIAEGLRRLAAADLRAHLGEKARHYVVNEFSMTQVLAREIELLQGVGR